MQTSAWLSRWQICYFIRKKCDDCCYCTFDWSWKNRTRHLFRSISASESTQTAVSRCRLSATVVAGSRINCYLTYVSMEAYIVCCVFLRPVTDISATVAPIGVKFCMMVHIGPRRVLSPFGAVPPEIFKSKISGRNLGHLTANISKTVIIIRRRFVRRHNMSVKSLQGRRTENTLLILSYTM